MYPLEMDSDMPESQIIVVFGQRRAVPAAKIARQFAKLMRTKPILTEDQP